MGQEFPNITGDQHISDSWGNLLIRDGSLRVNFAGTSFPTGMTEDHIGISCYRIDQGTLWLLKGFDENNEPVWDYPFIPDSEIIIFQEKVGDENFPDDVTNVYSALQYLASKAAVDSIVYPPESFTVIADGITDTVTLQKSTKSKNTVAIYFDGVKQNEKTYKLIANGAQIQFNSVPPAGTEIEVEERASVLEYGYIPTIKLFQGDGVQTEFDMGITMLNKNLVDVVIDGITQMKKDFELNGTKVVFPEPIKSSGEGDGWIQISTIKQVSINEAAVIQDLVDQMREQLETATTKASEAFISANNASASETNAKTSETNAKDSETNAKASEESASEDANKAETALTEIQKIKPYLLGALYDFDAPQDGNPFLMPLNMDQATTGYFMEDVDTNYEDFWNYVTACKQKAISGDTRFSRYNKTQGEYNTELERTTLNGRRYCGWYVIDEEAKTVRLPFFGDAFKRGQWADEPVGLLDAIRNIQGEAQGIWSYSSSSVTGAFSKIVGSTGNIAANGAWANTNFKFNAGNVVPVADENRPRSVGVYYYLCVASTGDDTVNMIELQTILRNYTNNLLNEVATEGANWVDQAETYANLSNVYNKMSNCVIEHPQNINLVLENGTVTLKTGSVNIYPNGFEADGTTPKFDKRATTTDLEMHSGIIGMDTEDYLLLAGPDGGFGGRSPNNNGYFGTGPTAPTNLPNNDFFWYDTTENLLKRTADKGVTWQSGYSLPFGLYRRVKGAAKSILQVFNGLGFVGSTVWLDQGVKVLIPDGKNPDGSLKNIVYVTPRVLTAHRAYASSNQQTLFLQSDGLFWFGNDFLIVEETPAVPDPNRYFSYSHYYNITDNYMYMYNYNESVTNGDFVRVGRAIISHNVGTNKVDSSINSVQFSSVASFLKTSDIPRIMTAASQGGFPASSYDVISISNGGTAKAPSNGYFLVAVTLVEWGGFSAYIQGTGLGFVFATFGDDGAGPYQVIVPASKGQTLYVNAYNTLRYVRFIYSQGEKKNNDTSYIL